MNFNPDQVTRLQVGVKITDGLEIFLVSSVAPRRTDHNVKGLAPGSEIRPNHTGLDVHQRIMIKSSV